MNENKILVEIFDISIVIVSWNVADLLCDCIDSIVKYASDINYEVIVIDNNSTDNTISLLQEKYSWER